MAHTALLLTDVQEQIFFHMPPEAQKMYLETVKRILDHFRSQIAARRAEKENVKAGSADAMAPNEGIPMIIHHLVPVGHNSHAFISSYNKINSTWATKRLSGVQLPPGAADPNTPWFAIPGGAEAGQGVECG
jgi:hypothetical protein